MKVKVISRHPSEYQRETKHDIFKAPRNYAAPPDPFQQQVEYTRALNAAKLERIFAKPFLAAFDGHNEAVDLLVKHPARLSTVLSGARDGQVRVWHLATRRCVHTVQAHSGPINGLSVDARDGTHFVTVGQDAQLKVWPLPAQFDEAGTPSAGQPVHSVSLDGVPHGCSHVAMASDFVTCGDGISVWRLHRSSPIRHYDVGPNTVQHINCNPIEDSIMAGCAADRSIFLFDTRQKVPLSRVVLKLRTNRIAWHPLEPFTFVAANEDYNLYTFDMRRLDSARHVHQGHTSAVMDVDFAPSGHEFVSGSFDRSLRIFSVEQWRSRDVYHTPRMQYVLSVLWSADNKFVLSGSDDMNIRLWKANAAEKLGPLCPREKAALEYSRKLRETYQGHPEVRRIVKHRHVPKAIYSAAREHKIIRESQRKKDKNRRKNTKSAATEPHTSERAKAIVSEGLE
uniref:WD_REPEATS_REGION domain-containing protein n=1 Tax=Globodera pallida TaxID=36090 RepID=A0A183C347_GLOPA